MENKGASKADVGSSLATGETGQQLTSAQNQHDDRGAVSGTDDAARNSAALGGSAAEVTGGSAGTEEPTPTPLHDPKQLAYGVKPGQKFKAADGTLYEVRERKGRRPKGEPPAAGVRSEDLGARAEGTYRRAPRIKVIVGLGFVLGLIAALVLQLIGPGDGADLRQLSGPFATYMTLAVVTCTVSTLVAAIIALLLDAHSRR